MASGGKRGAGDRVLESKHVIGLFMLMLLFSGVFFTLGYVMGRNQYDGQVRAAVNTRTTPDVVPLAKPNASSKHAADSSSPDSSSDPATAHNSNWGFYENSKSSKATEPLRPAATTPAPKPVSVKSKSSDTTAKPKTSMNAPLIPGGSYVVQVAALTKESDALALASTLQKRKFPAIVLSPQKDKYYRVQVGPYADQKAADAAKKGLEGAGFNAIVKHG
jgi:cell division septation protein DedD